MCISWHDPNLPKARVSGPAGRLRHRPAGPVDLPAPYAARIASLRRVIDTLDFEIDHATGLARDRLAVEWRGFSDRVPRRARSRHSAARG